MKELTVKLFVVFMLSSFLIGCGFGIEQSRKIVRPIPFDKQKWNIKDAEMRWDVRPGMARYLMNENLLIGKTQSEIYRMLGEENVNNYDEERNAKYELEQFYGSNIDPIAFEYLKIYFDENDKVNKVEVEFRKTGDW